MGLDIRYIPFEYLQEYFVDKDTGAPLAAGIVKFYKDNARTEPKSVYKLSGSPPNYTYTDLGNELTLSAVGTFQDSQTGDDINVYAFPYDTDGNVELYYITVESAGNVLQLTREGQPNIGETAGDDSSEILNYVSNGQFINRNYIPATDTTQALEITSDVTSVAPGGWYFMRSSITGPLDIVGFHRYAAFTTNPTGNPRYAIDIACLTPGSDSYKALSLRFRDVNRFASTDPDKKYRVYFEGRSLSGSPVNVTLNIRKNFGTNGSGPTTTFVHTFTLNTTTEIQQFAFSFGDNIGKTISTYNDDYVSVDFDFPPTSTFDVRMTNFVLTDDTGATLVSYPQLTNYQYNYRSFAGFLENETFDGTTQYLNQHLGLPVILKKEGLSFDRSIIGKIFITTVTTPALGELLCDGSAYEYNGYSSDAISYKRLGEVLWDLSKLTFRYGTGHDFMTGIYRSSPTIQVCNNRFGAVTATNNGTVSPGFTYRRVHTGNATGYYVKSYMVATDTFHIENLNVGTVNAADPGTSGFTVNQIVDSSITSGLREISSVKTVAASGLAGLYFTFESYSTSAQLWYVWFKVNGVGTDPAPAGNPILVELETADTAAIVAEKVRQAINGWEVTDITCVAGSSIPAGSYFNIYTKTETTTQHWVVWYQVDGSGTQPVVSGAKYIEVRVLSTHGSTTIAFETCRAINKHIFAVPDLRGMFIRGWDNGRGVDEGATSRWSMVPGIIGDVIGTEQLSANIQHAHIYQVATTTGTNQSTSGTDVKEENISTDPDGDFESRPRNIYMNYVIKY